jgi:DNA polymerase-3 subunit delta'
VTEPIFKKAKGHRDVMERLGRLAFSGRMGQAFLFLGPQGVGRKLIARGWTQVLNCQTPLPSFPYACGQCRPCKKIDSGQFPDLFVVSAGESKTLKIDQIREVLREAHYKPYEGQRRVFIIDDADLMNDAAANALLKNLEEPSETLVLILIAEHEGQLLPTIRSRCQMVRFGTLPNDIVRGELIIQGVSETDARWLANEAAGSLGRAAEALAGKEERQELRGELFGALRTLGQDPLAPFRMAEMFKKDHALAVLRLLKVFYRDAVACKLGKRERIVNLDVDNDVCRFADSRDLADLLAGFDAVEQAERHMDDYNANKQLVLERLLQELTPPPQGSTYGS